MDKMVHQSVFKEALFEDTWMNSVNLQVLAQVHNEISHLTEVSNKLTSMQKLCTFSVLILLHC